MQEQIHARLPNKTEIIVIKAIMKNPQMRNRVLINNGMAPKTDDLPKEEYICVDCQYFKELPKWDDEWEDLAFHSGADLDQLEEQYYCPHCEERMVTTSWGEY